MKKKIIAYDLGTGGNKASLYDADGECLSSTFYGYETLYPQTGMHEQRRAAGGIEHRPHPRGHREDLRKPRGAARLAPQKACRDYMAVIITGTATRAR